MTPAFARKWLLTGVVWAPAIAFASNALVNDLEKRLAADGVDKLNVYLGVHAATHLIPLHQHTASCEFDAVSLSVQLARGGKSKGGAKVVDAHQDSLRAAVGNCPGFVLALLSPPEVPKVCASIDSWTVMQTVRELRQRIKRIETDESLITSTRGQACRAAYLYELKNTRVGLRARKP